MYTALRRFKTYKAGSNFDPNPYTAEQIVVLESYGFIEKKIEEPKKKTATKVEK